MPSAGLKSLLGGQVTDIALVESAQTAIIKYGVKLKIKSIAGSRVQ